ncbi:hypothetical protein K438DRAFT_1971148 [Mycena galopus ATCC 62051]|nr:hypothetical protein K438DRAFT_1971148 [Mycena galopus ATCC 62051]
MFFELDQPRLTVIFRSLGRTGRQRRQNRTTGHHVRYGKEVAVPFESLPTVVPGLTPDWGTSGNQASTSRLPSSGDNMTGWGNGNWDTPTCWGSGDCEAEWGARWGATTASDTISTSPLPDFADLSLREDPPEPVVSPLFTCKPEDVQILCCAGFGCPPLPPRTALMAAHRTGVAVAVDLPDAADPSH